MTQRACPFNVKAIAPYTARSETELDLVVGQMYSVLQTDGKDVWWQSQATDGRYGWFPANYTEVIEAPPPTPQVSTLPPVPAAQATTPAATEKPTSSRRSSKRKEGSRKKRDRKPAASASDADISVKSTPIDQSKGKRKIEDVPPPAKPTQVEDEPQTPAYLQIQLVEAKDLPGGEKISPTAFIYRRDVYDRDNKWGDHVFNTSQIKKKNAPRWNEKFQLNCDDAEREVIIIRVANCSKHKAVQKKLLGELSFPLRSAARDFDRPNPQFKWYDLKKDNNKCGEIKVFIEFINTKEVSAPKDVKQVSHIGWSADGGFEINNIPTEWKKVFKSVGIRKKDLEANPELRKEVFNIMQEAVDDGAGASSAPAPPVPSGGGGKSKKSKKAPAPAPEPVSTGAAPPPPPPPPMGGGGGGAPKPPQAPKPSGNGGLPPPPTPKPSGNTAPPVSDGGGDLLAAIRKGKSLNHVDETEQQRPAAGGGTLADTLMRALDTHRLAVEGDDDDDWSDDDWSDSD